MKHPYVLPEAFLKCLSPADRKSLGKAGMTAEEAIIAFAAKTERKLQSQIVQLLRLKGIEPLWHRTDKKSAATIGWPDITFSIQDYPKEKIYPCAWEVKLPGRNPSEEQDKMGCRLVTAPNYWLWALIRSVDEALKELRAMGIK